METSEEEKSEASEDAHMAKFLRQSSAR
jgi:hypothetical protein